MKKLIKKPHFRRSSSVYGYEKEIKKKNGTCKGWDNSKYCRNQYECFEGSQSCDPICGGDGSYVSC